MRKTSNLLIRESSKKSNKDINNPTATNSSFNKSVRLNKQLPTIQQFEMQKEMMKAQNLTEEEQKQIIHQARKTMTKKVKKSEIKMENEVIGFLENECTKLGGELERQKAENTRGKQEIERLRKNISYLNEKLQKVLQDQNNLSKNQIDGKVQQQQLLQQLNIAKNLVQRKDDQLEYIKRQRDSNYQLMQSQLQEQSNKIEQLVVNNKNLLSEKQELEEELQEKTMEVQVLREELELKKKQWEKNVKSFEENYRNNLQKKGEKITRFQADNQRVQEKLKQEQGMRKKMIEKNKELEKKWIEEQNIRKQLQAHIQGLKKRVNDLSILKSSNNTIMNQKIQNITEQNQRLKKELQDLKNGHSEPKVEKPVLFGAHDFD